MAQIQIQIIHACCTAVQQPRLGPDGAAWAQRGPTCRAYWCAADVGSTRKRVMPATMPALRTAGRKREPKEASNRQQAAMGSGHPVRNATQPASQS